MRRSYLKARSYHRVENVRTRSEAVKLVETTGGIACVIANHKPKALVLKCPDGCGEMLTVNLLAGSERAWRLRFDRDDNISLFPSVKRTNGCRSHFVLIRNCAYLIDKSQKK